MWMWLSASDSTKISGGPADDEKAQRRLVANYSMRLTLNRLVAILGEKRSADSDGRGDDDNSAMLAPHDASHLTPTK